MLVQLAATRPEQGTDVLALLPGEPLAIADNYSFTQALSALITRRVDRHRNILGSRLPDLDTVLSATLEHLNHLPSAPVALIHGDLVPSNILVSPDLCTPTALLDFGFLSTIGDPAFEAAVAASIFDMYGPNARDTEARLDGAIAERLGYAPHTLSVYRAAYALATSNAFADDGSDGHFAWCIDLLNRHDIRAALLSA